MSEMTDEDHREDHAWIRGRRESEQRWLEQKRRIIWTVITSVVTGAVLSIFPALWWAIKVFVSRGGV